MCGSIATVPLPASIRLATGRVGRVTVSAARVMVPPRAAMVSAVVPVMVSVPAESDRFWPDGAETGPETVSAPASMIARPPDVVVKAPRVAMVLDWVSASEPAWPVSVPTVSTSPLPWVTAPVA